MAIIRVYPSKNPGMEDLIYFKVVQIMEESDFKEKVMNLNKEKIVELFIRHLCKARLVIICNFNFYAL